jgi:hypothetical protein
MDNAIGTSAGRQIIDSDGAKSTTIVLDNTAYIRGDLKAIVSYFRFSTRHPKAIADRWISLSSTNAGFANVSASMTLASDFHQIGILGPLTEDPKATLDGLRVVPIKGHVKTSKGTAAAILYVTATGTILPIEFHVTSGKISQTIVWSEWGRTVTIVAPGTSIPITSIKP